MTSIEKANKYFKMWDERQAVCKCGYCGRETMICAGFLFGERKMLIKNKCGSCQKREVLPLLKNGMMAVI